MRVQKGNSLRICQAGTCGGQIRNRSGRNLVYSYAIRPGAMTLAAARRIYQVELCVFPVSEEVEP